MRGRRRSWRQDVNPLMKVEGVSYSPVSKYGGVILHLEELHLEDAPPPVRREDALGPPRGPRVLLRQGRLLSHRLITITGACQPTAALSSRSLLAPAPNGDIQPARGRQTVSRAVSSDCSLRAPAGLSGRVPRLAAPSLDLHTLDGRPGIGQRGRRSPLPGGPR